MGKLFLLRVYLKNCSLEGKPLRFLSTAAVSNAAISLISPETPVFHLDA